MTGKLRDASDEINKNLVNSINEKLTKIKILLKMCLKITTLRLKRIKR